MKADRTASSPVPPALLPATLKLGAVHLTVADLDRSVAWYERALGLRVHRRDGSEAELGDGIEACVVVRSDPEARPAGRHAGLYHYALLYPTREELARAALRALETRTPVQGMSDHGTHEAIYLPDADGNGIELAADRPPEEWPSDPYAGGPAPLGLQSLLDAARDERVPEKVAEGLRVGHLHLQVGDIDAAISFYRDVIGFEVQANLGTAAFVSAGGYHHHLGFNVWQGEGVGPPPAHTIGLRNWTVELPAADDVADVRARIEAAGFEVEPVTGGFRAHDPWRLAVDFVAR